MESAKKKFAKSLESIEITFPIDYLVYSNVTGRPYNSVDEIRRLLPIQIVSPIQWQLTITDMIKLEKVSKFIECAPMDTLSRMMRLIAPYLDPDCIMASDDNNNRTTH